MSLLDDDVLTLYISKLSQPLPKGSDTVLVAFHPLQRQVPDPLDLPCRLRLGNERPGEEGEDKGEGAGMHYRLPPRRPHPPVRRTPRLTRGPAWLGV
jgi:hypothetical protein